VAPSHHVTNLLFPNREIRWWSDEVSTANKILDILRIGRRKKKKKHSKQEVKGRGEEDGGDVVGRRNASFCFALLNFLGNKSERFS
jgi:hypothetical protein